MKKNKLISNSDTIKQDAGLVIAGLLGALLFFWFYSELHPLGAADNSYGEQAASKTANEILNGFGFHSGREPVTSYRIQNTLLDSLQKKPGFRELYSSERNRNLFPAFYWQSSFYMGPVEEDDTMPYQQERAQTIQVQLSELGRLLALENEHDLFPETAMNRDALLAGLGDRNQPDIAGLEFRTDSSVYDEVVFNFSDNLPGEESPLLRDRTGRLMLGEESARRIAEYHLSKTGWPQNRFSLQQMTLRSAGDVDVAEVVFEANDDVVGQETEVTLTVFPAGGLLSMTYSFPSGDSSSGLEAGELADGVRIFLVLLGFVWILVLLVIRFRLRLIDTKPAILIAVLAGFIFPFSVAVSSLYNNIHSFGEMNAMYIFMEFLLPIGMVVAIFSILYFIVTAISDSITRQHWEEKLRSIDLIRIGHLVNKPVGQTLIRGISYSFILAAVWAVLLRAIPGSYLAQSEDFFTGSRYVANLSVIFDTFVYYLAIAQVLFLIVLGQLRSHTKSGILLIFTSGLIFVIIHPLFTSVDTGPLTTEIVMLGITGMLAGWIYIREEFLTVFIALFTFGLLLVSASGWVLHSSPDVSVFYSVVILILAGFAFGCYGYYKGKSIKELPAFVPDYINELAHEERIKGELEVAHRVQEGLLPDRTPDIPGLDIAAICKPAYETGGDYYDFIPLDDGRLAVVIGDVSGKGIEAAFFMTFTKGILHALCNDYTSAIDLLVKTNRLFRKNANRNTFISLIFGMIDTARGSFSFSRAGHNPLLYYNSQEKKLYEHTPKGIGLGMAPDELFVKNIVEEKIDFKSGDIIMMFTDGVVEAKNEQQAFYGDKKLQGLIEKYADLCAEELLDKIKEDVETFGKNTSQHDDMTMVIIKKK